MTLLRATCVLVPLAVLATSPLRAETFPTPLAEEPIPNVERLPEKYPASWMIVHDFNFPSLPDGRGVVIDTADPVRPLKGFVQVAQFGNVLHPASKPELYTAETYYPRLSRGERTDVITIWDKATLSPKAEIVLPGGKRHQSVTYKTTFQFTNNEKWAIVSNFTPAQSVTIVDLDGRKVLGDIELPGCSMIYPTGERGFSTFCADGTITTVALDEAGKMASSVTSKPILDIDNHPLFAAPAMVGKTAWFVSYKGKFRGFDMSGPAPKEVPGFMAGTAEGAAPEWRPSGWQVITSDAAGRLYALMSPAGKEGSHKDGSPEVWVFDPAKKARVARIPLKMAAATIEVTREAQPRLVVVRVDMGIDVYDAASGAFVHSLGNSTAYNPLTLTAVQ